MTPASDSARAHRKSALRPFSAALLALGLVTSCSAAATPSQPSQPTPATRTVIRTIAPTAPPVAPAPVATVGPLSPGAAPPRGEVERRCPYIASSQTAGADSVADIEGDRVYRTTVVTTDEPVGCRFYFWAPPYEAVADIRPRRFPSASDAHNAMVLTARTGTELIVEPGFVRGVDGICFRTRFFGPDGAGDWAFAFAKANVMVVVHTQRNDTSRNAVYLARAIAGKF